jgi:precorrin isomerase
VLKEAVEAVGVLRKPAHACDYISVFVNAAESKERLRSLEVPSMACVGIRAGTLVAVAVANELVEMAINKK